MSRMMCYAWVDLDGNNGEVKFGDHFVSNEMSLAEAEQHTIKYMRTQFPRRGKHFDSDRVLKHVWDISEYAKKHNKFYGASKIDDVIRPVIGFAGKVGKEFHALPFDEVIIRVNEELARIGQPLPRVGLSPNQYRAAEDVLDAIADGKKTILAELCARFGKTIWSGALIRETGAHITIVATYVLTVTSSFKKDLTSFNQFQDIVHVDTAEDDYQEKIEFALKRGKQVVAYLSMCNGSKRKKRIDYLFDLPVPRMLIVDEADFGTHQVKQAKPLIEARSEEDTVILMTGTNADKAASVWEVDHMLSVTYPELIMEKRLLEESLADVA